MIDDRLICIFKILSISEENILKELSNFIDIIINNKIEDIMIICNTYDSILRLEFIENDKKSKVFHKLSKYCRKFDELLANTYDLILEDYLSDDF